MTRMLSVTAPSDLEAGYQFEAIDDRGQRILVTVPEGGVKHGQVFQVALEDPGASAVEIDHALPPDAVTGRWKNDLCSWCDVCCKAVRCCSFWCTPVTEAQLLTRMKLTACGEPGTPERVSSTFGTVLVIFICYLVFSTLVPVVVTVAWLIYRLIYATRLRHAFRQKYSIPPSCFDCCDGKMDDCCCNFFCGCCTTIQMARHTHDETRYPYLCCNSTGLPPDAPEI